MESAFKPTADFYKMTSLRITLFIDGVLHMAVVEVNEDGTKAAGVAAIPVLERAPLQKERFTLAADRPFFFTVCDFLDWICFVCRHREQTLKIWGKDSDKPKNLNTDFTPLRFRFVANYEPNLLYSKVCL
ncbi:MAG: serpin family protein [Armatimonadota bacterium]|nr:serpin family protein [Armatimonadota bacterium]